MEGTIIAHAHLLASSYMYDVDVDIYKCDREVWLLFSSLAPMITPVELPVATSPLLVGEIAQFTTTVMSVPAPEVTWMVQIVPFALQGLPLEPDGDTINVTLQSLSGATYTSVLSLQVPEAMPGTMLERYFPSFDNGFATFGDTNDAGQLIRAGTYNP